MSKAPSQTPWQPPILSSKPPTPSPTSRTPRSNLAPRSPSGMPASSPSGPVRRCPSACAPSWPPPSASPTIGSASSCPIPARHTEASIPANAPWKPRAWRKPPASPSSSCGPAKKNSPGPTSAPPASSKSRAAPTANHFAREVHIDELAHALKMDPLEFRLKNLKDDRPRAVLHAAADRFQWGAGQSNGQGIGIACGFEKNGYIATCAQVAVEEKRIRILRVVEAFDCGAVVNPDHLKNQIQGAIAMALGGALFEQMRFGDGQISNARFSQYRMPRFSDMPEMDVVLVDRPDLPSAGAGETPIVGLAPAVANAVFHLNGTRLRSLPLEL